ncbi:MAG: hypothetical protein ALAOOOJD_01824 [bacterium]|nr:hypothetical protein [bacterium]
MMAPKRPPKITSGVTILISIKPFPMVLATSVPKNMNEMKLKKAAQMTACRGERTRVETIVATEFAASCTPFVKSNTKAIPITMTIKVKFSIVWKSFGATPELAGFHNNAADDIRNALVAIHCFLQAEKNVFLFDNHNRVFFIFEEITD